MHGKTSPEPRPELPRTHRVELIAFPDKTGDELRREINGKHGCDCLRFREVSLAPDILLGDSLVRCTWLPTRFPVQPTQFEGAHIAFGRDISCNRQIEIISAGYTAVIDLEDTTIEDAAKIVVAYSQQFHHRHRKGPAGPSDTLPSAPPVFLALDKKDQGTEYLASAVEMLEIGVYVLDEQNGGRISVWNSEMERLFLRSKKEVLGKQIHQLFDDPLVQDVFRDMPNPYNRNRAIFPKKGITRSNFIADISKTQLRDKDGKPAAIVGIIQDVTNRIHSENRLIAAFNELETSKEKLEQSNLEIRKGIEKAKKLAVVAQSSNKAKSYFLSNISHELRTPLNSIVSLTHALLEGTFGELNAKQHEHLEIVSDSSKHLQSLINDILDLSKIELGKMNLKFAPASVEDVARSSIRMIEQEASLKNVSCILEILTNRDSLEVDAKRLRQILLNLLVNAVKFTKPNTNVTLRILEDKDLQALAFQIIDNGIGIDEENFAKIFSPFTQLDDSLSRQYEGTGLGLAIASKFVELHGGGLKVQSTPDVGSTFTVTLPLHQPRDDGDTTLRPTLAEIATHAKSGRDLLLIVDDNELSALRIEDQVKRFTSYKPVLTLPNEISAYHDQVAPKAIFVDLNIISSHGTDWIQNARKLPAWKKAKWIALGSLDLPDNHKAARRLGFDTCSCKPISQSLLSKILR
ncbi:PAS domain-containing sensor histidine kinase [Pelagicoccus sp. SDUM812005]|uniref:PAS domain-containing sensor histidine kinase n=1 Tax=Pelagicoccus sp. SDUM812005 TaxID=3041257 RepID=UPI00280F6193|nr:PAS domain-containing sensor histidine kinase [Pelagicoccus sp. SDUM812005]MDQ8180194.1 PAS domain-containing sensor histidine kinase [Pelagicoccus sp. SDUM812005]